MTQSKNCGHVAALFHVGIFRLNIHLVIRRNCIILKNCIAVSTYWVFIIREVSWDPCQRARKRMTGTRALSIEQSAKMDTNFLFFF